MSNLRYYLRRKFGLNDLRTQLVFWIVIVTVAPLVTLSVGLYYHNYIPLLDSLFDFNRSLLSGNILNEQTNEAGRLADQITSFLSQVKSQAIIISKLLAFSTLSQSDQKVMLVKLLDQFQAIDYIVVRDQSDRVSSVGREGRLFSAQLQVILSDSVLFQRTLAGEVAFSQPFCVEDSREIAMVVSLPIISELGQPLGGLFLQVDLKDVQELTLQAAKNKPGTIYVVDSEGVLLGHVEFERVLNREDMSGLEIVGNYLIPGITVGSIPYKNKDSEDVQGAYTPIKDFRWGVVTERSITSAFSAVNDMMEQSTMTLQELALATLVGVISTAILAVGIGAFLAVRISSPIREISKGAIDIAKGNFARRFHVEASKDIKQLADTLNFMGEEIERYTTDLERQATDMRNLFLGSVESLAAAIDAKDPYTKGHSKRVRMLSMKLGKSMGLSSSRVEDLEISALMHDVGKIGIDDAILKKPSVITDEERKLLQMHPSFGASIMKPIPLLEKMIPGMLQHHERWDGSGYPFGLKNEQIDLFARIIAVADTFDAMTSDRPYQKTYTFEEARDLIRQYSGTRYDPLVVSAFLDIYSEICKLVAEMRE